MKRKNLCGIRRQKQRLPNATDNSCNGMRKKEERKKDRRKKERKKERKKKKKRKKEKKK